MCISFDGNIIIIIHAVSGGLYEYEYIGMYTMYMPSHLLLYINGAVDYNSIYILNGKIGESHLIFHDIDGIDDRYVCIPNTMLQKSKLSNVYVHDNGAV